MLNNRITSVLPNMNFSKAAFPKKVKSAVNSNVSMPSNLKTPNSENLKAYIPSFNAAKTKPEKLTPQQQLNVVMSKLDRDSLKRIENLDRRGILLDKSSNDGSTVLDNMYKIATEPRIKGLSDKLILAEVIKALDNPYSITQKFGDIPIPVARDIARETGKEFPNSALNVTSSSCVVASMEFNLAEKTPAEFARFAQGLSGANYCVDKKVQMSSISDSFTSGIWMLREFETDCTLSKNWEDITVKIRPDRNAIVRARVQTSYKDPGERSCVDVLIQSALLNLGSQNSYNALIDERQGKFNPDKSGLTDFEKNFVEEIVFDKPKISVVYQNLDENGKLIGYNCDLSEMKQHILSSLKNGQNVIIGYTHLNKDNVVEGGHEITITDYITDENGREMFICNDTDDNIDRPIKKPVDELLPLIHHAGIMKNALNENDVVVEHWREILSQYQQLINNGQQ